MKFDKWTVLLPALVIGAIANAAEVSSAKAGEAAKVAAVPRAIINL